MSEPGTSSGRRWLKATLEAGATGLVLAAVLTIVTIRADDNRSERERRLGLEQGWRTQLVASSQFPRAVIEGLDLAGIHAPSVDLVGARLSGTSFDNSNLVEANLQAVVAEGTTFARAQLDGASLVGSALTDVSFEGASLDGADLRGVRMAGGSLRGASLFRTDVRGVDLSTVELDQGGLLYACFDDSTVLPQDGRPAHALCPAETADSKPSAAVNFQIETFAFKRTSESGPNAYDLRVISGAGEVGVVVRFKNIGVAPLNDVKLVVDFPAGIKPTKVTLSNGNFPNGYEFPASAIQAEERQVNVSIGAYDASINATIAVDATIGPEACGSLQVVAYSTPEGFGTTNNSAYFDVPC